MERPQGLTVNLVVKVGQPILHTKTVYGKPMELRQVVAHSYSVFWVRVQERIAAIEEIIWSDNAQTYYRPTANTRQSRFEPLATDNETFSARLHQMWKLAPRQKQG